MLQQTHAAFAANARVTAPSQRFRPAERDGRKVRVLVEFPVAYSVRATEQRIRTVEEGQPFGTPSRRVP